MAEEVRESAESAIESGARDSLNELKQSVIKETLDEIINKDSGLFSGAKKKLLERYLDKQGDILEFFEDLFIRNLLENDISDELDQFKENIYKAQSRDELDAIKASFLNEVNKKNPYTSTNDTHTDEVTQSTAKTATSTTASVASSITSTTENHNNGYRKSPENQSRQKRKKKEKPTSSSEHYAIDNFNIDVSQKYKNLYDKLKGPELPDLEPFACAIKGYNEMKESLKNPKYLTIVDFTKPNDKNRFYVINMTNNTVEYATTVGHGSGSGKGRFAKSFSNTNGSYQSSLGFYRVPDNIEKKSRWSGIRMMGTEGSNDNASSRGIYMHPGGGISKGCFTLPKDKAMEIMNKIKGDSLLFAYAKSKEYFAQSDHFDTNSNGDVLAA